MPFKIRTKLLSAFSAIIIPFIVIGTVLVIYSADTIHKSVHKVRSIAEERAVLTNLILTMEEALMPGNDYIITGDKKYIYDFYKISDEVEKRMKEAKGILHDPVEEGNILNDTNTAWRNTKEISIKIFAISNPAGSRDAAMLMEEMDYKWAYPAIKRLKDLRDTHIEEFQNAAKIADRVWMHSWIIMISGTFVVTAFGIFFAFFYSSRFSGPIEVIHNGADAIANGNFKTRMDIKTGDEIEQLANAMNEMAVQLDSLYSNLQGMVEERTRELKESEERFRVVSETAGDAIICLAAPDRITLWNSKAEEMFGYTAASVIGSDLHRLIVTERYREKAVKGLTNFFETGEGPIVGKTIEIEAKRKDGSEFPIELSVSAMKIKGEWQSTGIIRDITERKKAEEKIEKQLDFLQRFEKVAIGREFRIKELRDRVGELEKRLKG